MSGPWGKCPGGTYPGGGVMYHRNEHAITSPCINDILLDLHSLQTGLEDHVGY